MSETMKKLLTEMGFTPRPGEEDEWMGTVRASDDNEDVMMVAFIEVDGYNAFNVVMFAQLDEEGNYDSSDAMHLSTVLLMME